MIGLFALIFIGDAWAQCNPLDPSCQAGADAKRNAWKQKVVYCDSTIEPIQHCKDLTPCSPQYLDCTKGPNRCICEIVNPVAGAGAASSNLKFVLERISTIPSASTFSFVIKDPHFSDFVSLLNKAGQMTIFVPSNEAFQNAGVDTSNYQQMKEILKYHLIPNSALLTPSLSTAQMVINGQGNTIKVSKEQNDWMVDHAKVILPDLRVSNGVIWLIDRVLTPQSFEGIQPQGIVDQGLNVNPNAQGLGFITNRAFQDTKGNVPDFNRHQEQTSQQIISEGQQAPQGYGQGLAVGQGQGITRSSQGWVGQQQGVAQGFVQGQRQTSFQGQGNLQGQEDLAGQQGFIGYQSGVDQSNSNDHGAKSIAEFVRGNPMLTTFAFLLNDPRYSDIVQLLSGSGPVTVFIPTNEGFAKSGIDATNVPLVRDMLKHHIVPNMAVNSADFVPFQKFFTAEGDKLKITQINPDWMVDDAKIVIPDVQAKNGVIFLIDRALVPQTIKTQLQNLGTASRGFQVSSPNQGSLYSQEFRGVGQNQISGPSWNQGTFQDANRGFEGPRVSESSGVQGQWHGSGLYCMGQTELYYCDDKQKCVLQESCKLGCVHADPGFPDYCFTPDSKTNSRGGFQLPKTPNFQLPNINQPPFQQSQQQNVLVGRWNQ